MWITRQTEDEFVVNGIPVFLWAGGGALLGVGVYLLILNLPSFLVWAKPAERPYETFILGGALFFIPVTALVVLAIAPLIVTRIDRKNRVVYYTKYGVLGIQRRRFPYDNLNGGVRIRQEKNEDDGGYFYSAYFDLKSGERMKMCSEPGNMEGRNYDVAMTANDYLRGYDPVGSDIPPSSEEVVSLHLNG